MSKNLFNQKLKLVKSRLNTLDYNPSEEQLDFILHPLNKPCYLNACPGSGKTEVVGIKAAYEICDWKERFRGIAVLSFTKNASKEISNRIKKYGGINSTNHPHFIGTIDSWIHGYILHPFAHKSSNYNGKNNDKSYRLVDNEEDYDFLTPFKTIFSYDPYREASVNDYYFECSEPPTLQSQSKFLDLDTINEASTKLLQDNKKKFLKSGLTTYADAEFLCYYFLKKNEEFLLKLTKRFPIIIIDECQDLSNNQLEIFRLLKNAGTILHFVGDTNQSIYEFKKVYTKEILAFIQESRMIEKLLTENFRSNQKIVNVCMNLEKYNTGFDPIKITGSSVEVITDSCIVWEYTTSDLSCLPQKFIDFINNHNENTKIATKKISLKKSAILSRAHSTLSDFKSQPSTSLSKIEMLACSLCCWSNNPRTTYDIQNALQLLGKSISLYFYNGNGDHQNQFCPEVYSLIEWRQQLKSLIIELVNPVNDLYPFGNQIWTQWACNLKKFMTNYHSNFRSPASEWKSVKNKVKSPSGHAKKLVDTTLKANVNNYSEKLRMTTFHDVKGESLDAVLIVSAKDRKSKGGHYEQWITTNENEKEYVRFAYVASSRPRHLLIWAIPKKKQNNMIKDILNLGFVKI